MGIIGIMLVAIIPAVSSLSKSSGRKSGISNLTILVEQARSLALSDSRNTYVAFTTALPSGALPTVIDDYSYRSYAVFEDDALGAPHAIQVTKWQKLPPGISFRSAWRAKATSDSSNSSNRPRRSRNASLRRVARV